MKTFVWKNHENPSDRISHAWAPLMLYQNKNKKNLDNVHYFFYKFYPYTLIGKWVYLIKAYQPIIISIIRLEHGSVKAMGML